MLIKSAVKAVGENIFRGKKEGPVPFAMGRPCMLAKPESAVGSARPAQPAVNASVSTGTICDLRDTTPFRKALPFSSLTL